MNHPLFLNEVLVHEQSGSVGVAKVTYYPVDQQLSGIRIGLELKDGSKKDFALVELRGASPNEAASLQYDPESEE